MDAHPKAMKLSDVRKVLMDGTTESLRNYTFIVSRQDQDLANHGLNVASFASLLARQAGFSQHHTDIIWLAGLLHDIGKLFIPPAILHKSGPLDPHEWGVMRQHSKIGCEVLSEMAWTGSIAKLVRGHHERWDGTGYPDGLQGNQIEPGARVLAVADTLDAMTSNRSYRPGMSFEAARKEIAASAGAQFDPHIVNILLAVPEHTWQLSRTSPNPGPWCVPSPVTLSPVLPVNPLPSIPLPGIGAHLPGPPPALALPIREQFALTKGAPYGRGTFAPLAD